MSYENIRSDMQQELNKQTTTVWEIADALHRIFGTEDQSIPLISFLLYKVSKFDNPMEISFQAILDGVLELDDTVLCLVREQLNEDRWNQILPLVTKFPSDAFKQAALTTEKSSGAFANDATPISVLKLASQLLDIQDQENVADICCGTGSFLVEAATVNPKAKYFGYEIVANRMVTAALRSQLLDSQIIIESRDVFDLVGTADMPQFDKIFSNYPFGLRLRNLGMGVPYLERLFEKNPNLSKATSSDWVFNSLLCDLLTENGKAVGIMTNGSTWNSIDAPVRKYFVENGLIECVIALPAKMFSFTNIPTTLIVLSHGNKNVHLVDASKIFQPGRRQNEFSAEDISEILSACKDDTEFSRNITVDELRENEYTLSLSRYQPNVSTLKNAMPFEKVIKSITRGAPCKANQLDEMVSESATNMQYLMLGNIKDGMIEQDLPYLTSIDPKYEKYCLKNGDLILSKNGYPYKLAVASVKENQRILANGNLYIIKLDEEKINPYYLKAFFESEQGIAALKSITVGAVIPNIGVDKLKKLNIPVPPLEEQQHVVDRYRATLDEIAVLKLKLERATNRLYHIFDEESEG